MSGYFTESNYENAVLQLLNEELGYTYVYGPDVERDYHSPLYEDALLPSLQRINKSLPMDALTEAIYKLKNFETGTLLQKNMVFMDYLQNGVPVKYYDKGEERSTLVYLVDFKNPASNEFTVANQWTFIENSEKRPDVILFVNGLPLVIVELKSPSREETDASAAYRQLRNYMYEIPSMFIYNAVCVMSDLTTSKAGTITSGEDRFMEWKTTDGSYENTQHASFDTFFVGLFEKTRFLDIVKNFICFNVDGQNTFKILAGYNPLSFLNEDKIDKNPAVICQSFSFEAIIGGSRFELDVMENIDVPSGMGDYTITLTRDETENYLKIEDALSFDCDRYECTPEEVAERFADSPIVRLCNAIIPATLGQEDLEEVFTWARFFNETGISAKLMNHPLTKLCEKLFDEHRLMDFHRCILDVDYRKLLLNELAHN